MSDSNGLLLIDKPAGPTSHDVVQCARRALQQKKIGHCGTLDPAATGLLVLTVGRATRLTRFLIRAPKVYEGVMRLGATTETWDAAGEVVHTEPFEMPSMADLEAVMANFRGQIEQPVPPYSAKKIDGVKQYERARQGKDVPRVTKQVTIFDLEVTEKPENGDLPFRLSCSSGTYARSLAHELGQALGCGAHLAALSRTQIGPFHLDQAISLDRLSATDASPPDRGWLGIDEIPLPFDELIVDQQQEERVSHGQTILVRELVGEEGAWIKLVSQRHELIAVGTIAERIGGGRIGVIQPKIVFRG